MIPAWVERDLESLDRAAARRRLRVLDSLPGKIARLAARLMEKVAPLAHVGEVRQRGTMVGIELVADRETKQAFPSAQRVAAR